MIGRKYKKYGLLGLLIFFGYNSLGWASLETDLTQGGVLFGEVEPASRVFYQEEEVRVSGDGRFVLGFGRDADLQQSYRVVHPRGKDRTVKLVLEPRTYKIQKINGVAKKYIQPAKAVLERIKLENKQVSQARLKDSLRDDFFKGFTWPLEGPITGVYGSQRVFNGQPRRPHFGVDIAAPVGAKVRAPADGRVTLAADSLYFSGGTLIIDHGYGVSSSFLHLSRVLVKLGQELKRGDVVAEVGATGRVTGAHLDWRINWFEKRLDPQLLAGAQE